ncbi:MAG: hypothetical protein E7479_03535 [Ruminococcaceae bacterium]|nr:hypothetical protein [Oscillospiraceae bacterium]
MDIYKSLNYISKLAFPNIKYTWEKLSINDDKPIFKISIFSNKIEDYFEDYYEKGIKSILQVIEKETLPADTEYYAKQLLVVLADNAIDYHSDICKNKPEIACKYFKKNSIFRDTVIEYSPHLYYLIPNMLACSFFHQDFNAVKDLCEKCYSKYVVGSEAHKKFIKELYNKFTYNHSFEKLITQYNAKKYWDIAEYIDKAIPELDFFKINDGITIATIKKDMDAIDKTRPSINLIKRGKYWINQKTFPEYIEFSFRYPNGINGDLIRYIFEEYGKVEKESASTWHGKISKEHIELFEIFSTIRNYISYDAEFLKIYDNYHLPTILYQKRWSIAETPLFKGLFHKELMDVLDEHKEQQQKNRSDLYAKLILLDRTSPKWKSEAQLFSLVSNIYPDAIYQYKIEWLGMQSLDIYIPSLSMGIEYQGIQHYEPIEHFGGEEHFKIQQANDKKKRKLCFKHNVKLIEWPYTELITKENLEKFLDETINNK